MDFEVKIIRDSISPAGKRLTTLTATYPRIIHAEIMTHRDRARNAASSRAIPFPTMMARIDLNPFVPIQWSGEQRGMQGGDEIPEALRPLAEKIWMEAFQAASHYASRLYYLHSSAHDLVRNSNPKGLGRLEFDSIARWCDENPLPNNSEDGVRIHKSIPNRLTEPFSWITVVMTATEWENFFRLRCHKDAEVHFQKIAGMIRDARRESEPQLVGLDEWHRPFFDEVEDQVSLYDVMPHDDYQEYANRVSVARCARVSYLNHDGKRNIEKDLEMFDKLVQGSGFGHWSAHEHVATPSVNLHYRSGPYYGWQQYRKQFPNENLPG